MVLAESKNRNGAGRGGDGDGMGAIRDGDIDALYTTEKHEADWYRMRSITQQNDIDGFLNTAELADTDFTAEKMSNLKIIRKDQINPYLLTADEEKAAKIKHRQKRQRPTVSRRPHWDLTTTPAELERREKGSLLHRHRGLVELQLWRVIEGSDPVVQIVDARNPLMFRCEDLERYVKEVDERETNPLLMNKADMMTAEQRSAWADCFEKEGISYRFFSAALAKQTNEEYASVNAEGEPVEEEVVVVVGEEKEGLSIRILTVDELEEWFWEHVPIIKGHPVI
ncbi:hypothetical protein C7212DRAFT_346705 [Tuber magnatum]|uniref:G domain-containing protein n=1 Tax=Tuber magnatum TaxID=42249 RepID=A0A317SGW5_9PEZI|nr:hypothetical protein C7212DRAFT_346705 [Tuber magnatum]